MPSKVVARRSNIHGTGVFARQDIKRGERIIEYRGTRRSHDDVDAGEEGDADSGHTFLFTLNDDWVIDGDRNGNIAKWINFSCSPNAEAVLEEHDGTDRRRDRVFIEAKRNIKAGDELTYDYNITLDVPHTARLKKIWECRCGAPNCKGTMLKSPAKKAAKKAAAKKAAKKAAAKKAPAKKAAAKKGTKTTRRPSKSVSRTPAAKKSAAKQPAARKSARKVTKASTATKRSTRRAVGRKAVAKKSLAKKRGQVAAPRRAAPARRGNGARR